MQSLTSTKEAAAVKKIRVPAAVRSQLTSFFARNGYVRFQNPERIQEGSEYKKGDEVRLIARSRKELATMRSLLLQAGFKPGKPFSKARQYAQPLYGREAVARFLDLIGYIVVENN